jgi:hypothetical protein
VEGGFLLRKKPLESSVFGVQQLWNRYGLDKDCNGESGEIAAECCGRERSG